MSLKVLCSSVPIVLTGVNDFKSEHENKLTYIIFLFLDLRTTTTPLPM